MMSTLLLITWRSRTKQDAQVTECSTGLQVSDRRFRCQYGDNRPSGLHHVWCAVLLGQTGCWQSSGTTGEGAVTLASLPCLHASCQMQQCPVMRAWSKSCRSMPFPTLLQVRKAQLAIGDREIFTNEEGERVSRLKEVNSDWIIRRLERWGRKVSLSKHQHFGRQCRDWMSI